MMLNRGPVEESCHLYKLRDPRVTVIQFAFHPPGNIDAKYLKNDNNNDNDYDNNVQTLDLELFLILSITLFLFALS